MGYSNALTTSRANRAKDGQSVFVKSVLKSMLSVLTLMRIGFMFPNRSIGFELQEDVPRNDVAELSSPGHSFCNEVAHMLCVCME